MNLADYDNKPLKTRGNRIYRRVPMKVRFYRLVDKTGECWLWTSSVCNSGYGVFALDSKTKAMAHRVSYELEYGEIPEGLVVMHTCDTKLCVRPTHLRLGRQYDNVQDMLDRNRQNYTKGADKWSAKLDEEKVRQIRELSKADCRPSYEEIGRMFNIDRSQISRIVRRELWAHVD